MERFKRLWGESRQFDHVEAEVPGAGGLTTLVHDYSLGFGNRYVAVDVNNGTTVLLQGEIQEQDNASRQRWLEPASLVLTWGDDENFLKQSFRPFFGIEMPNGGRPERMFIYGLKHIGGHTRNLDVLVYGAVEGGPLRQGFVMALRYHNGRWAGYVHRIPVSVNGPDGVFLTSSNPVREAYVVNGRLYALSTFGYPERSPSGAGLYVSRTPFETNTMSMVALEPMSEDPSISAEDRFWFVGSTLMRNDTLVTLSKRSAFTDGDTRFVMTARDSDTGSVRETTEWVDPDAKGGLSGLARFSRGRALFYQYGSEALELQLFDVAVQ